MGGEEPNHAPLLRRAIYEHSIVGEADFVDEDQASMLAVQLLYEVGCRPHTGCKQTWWDPRIQGDCVSELPSLSAWRWELRAFALATCDPVKGPIGGHWGQGELPVAFREGRAHMDNWGGASTDEATAAHLAAVPSNVGPFQRPGILKKPVQYHCTAEATTFSKQGSLKRQVRFTVPPPSLCALPCHAQGGSLSDPSVFHLPGRHHSASPAPAAVEPCVLPEYSPPGLLGSFGPPRPSSIAHIRAQATQLSPQELTVFPLSEIPIGQLKILATASDTGRGLRRYTCLDRLFHVMIRRAANDWSLADYFADAISANTETVRCARMLDPSMPNLAEPQIVLTANAVPLGHLVIPVDLRGLGGKVCCIVIAPGTTADRVIAHIMQTCGAPPDRAIQAAQANALFLQDANGKVWDTFPTQLDEIQWLSLCVDFRVCPELAAAARPASASTTRPLLPTRVLFPMAPPWSLLS